MSISAEIMQKFLVAAGERLTGSWVVIGGSVLHLLSIEARQTEDIDLAGPLDATQSDFLAMMEIAQDFGLPIEAINQAGAYFLHKIPNWQNKIIAVYRGSAAAIFRPNLELFFELKLARLSDADVTDCIHYLKYTIDHNEAIEPTKLLELCENFSREPLKASRVAKLIAAIEANVI